MFNLIGKTLGKYQIIERIGRGGMAEVYKGRHPRLESVVAIKVLYTHLVDQEQFLARFEREARAVAALRHPNIVKVFDFDTENDLYYMVMDFIDGGTFKSKISAAAKNNEFLPSAEILRIFRQVADALDYAHRQGMVHRDVKPANILLDGEGNAFLSDFGIAHIISGTHLTATGSLIGTPTYMSPEQCQGQKPIPASDIYSLGMILFEALTNQVPFADETPLTVIHKHIYEPLPSPRQFRPDLPEKVERVIVKALERQPVDRYSSAAQLLYDLETALAPEAAPVPPGIETTASGLEEAKTVEAQAKQPEPDLPIDELYTEVAFEPPPAPAEPVERPVTFQPPGEISESATVVDLASQYQPPPQFTPIEKPVAVEPGVSAYQPTIVSREEPEPVTEAEIIPSSAPHVLPAADETRRASQVIPNVAPRPVTQPLEADKPKKKGKPWLVVLAVLGVLAIVLAVILVQRGVGGGEPEECNTPQSCMDLGAGFARAGEVERAVDAFGLMEKNMAGAPHPDNAHFWCAAAETMYNSKQFKLTRDYAGKCFEWTEGLPALQDLRDLASKFIEMTKP